jgi:hypothetical protein
MDRVNTVAMWITVGWFATAFGLFFVVPALTSAPAEDSPALANPSSPTAPTPESVSTSAGAAHSGELALPAPEPEPVAPPAPAEEPAEEPVDEAAELLAMAVVIAEEYGKGPVDLDALDLDAVTRTQIFTVAAAVLRIYVDVQNLAEERGLRGYQRAFIEEVTPFMMAAPLAAGILASKGDFRGGLGIIDGMKAVRDEFPDF